MFSWCCSPFPARKVFSRNTGVTRAWHWPGGARFTADTILKVWCFGISAGHSGRVMLLEAGENSNRRDVTFQTA